MAKSFIPKRSIFELTVPYRTQNKDLLLYWERVRSIDDSILELSTKRHYSARLDESLFESQDNDEIILCLNYDGLYGINNINKFLQSSNPNPSTTWGIHTYKIGDPILFNDNDRFKPVLFNNLKGRIVAVDAEEDKIYFDLEVDTVLNEFDTMFREIDLMDNSENGNSIIRIYMNKYASTDEDESSNKTIVPFQVAYAVSIHKAQGLEYNSVKLVLTQEVDEMITHNIFYTAVTRARKSLKVYWTPESEQKILSNLEIKANRRDVHLLKDKYNLN